MTHRSRFARLYDEFRAVSGEQGSVPDLDALCRSTAVHLAAIAAAVSVPDSAAGAQTVGTNNHLARELEELQVTLGQGPSLEGLIGRVAILVDDLDAAVTLDRWPVFAPAAAYIGVRSISVVPMRLGAARLGVLALYFDSPGYLGAGELADAYLFASIGLDLLLDHAGVLAADAGMEPSGSAPFGDRPEIHQATGMASVQLGVDLGSALLLIRARAYADGRLLSETAADVVSRKIRFDHLEERSPS